ncbi:hypothetical protein, variant [Blastomyces dermatitidis ER-3]|uniref:Copper acquisition factor BIM1-like domain-containing protein n=1 Tax=Ajellomyces dermatitidis (strain ER-3 / ATCC MYA-2586) TaxID=559297 RepID=A0ABX2VTV6_AJEDR|nr:uncharacterized protein BDCG_01909 [Blastomyces dermatitidis ER-3]XP_045279835.1 hypothetical protein, variant [Blastomyces dermatitidis ER-3]EQL28206.1 hypothetical protein BDFG_09025 [Blastomyces dermatitidis ATCC 26199]EEQ86789.1 hypothetical protein BDCG_01909 [Blastomyces dermatitidis ER-3]EQL28207.1 hypothetical protein, variant [Blastomyces dermatitidis ATCC 26199]OAT00108.1 hypothetical protein, variant [Blastomyces dermatitidis ER-3]
MSLTRFTFALTLLLQLVSAHFSVKYPFWRGNSYSTQWERPCGGVNVTTNRTEWPVNGGSLLFNPTHPWAITYVNLGLGSDESVIFNISLVDAFNQTGNGTFCFPKIEIPGGLGITAGSNASVQVIQLSKLGSALYNCADITFADDVELLSADMCTNSSGIGWMPIGAAAATNNTPPDSGVGATLSIDQTAKTLGLGAIMALLFWNLQF